MNFIRPLLLAFCILVLFLSPAHAQSAPGTTFEQPNEDEQAVLLIYDKRSCTLRAPSEPEAALADFDSAPTEGLDETNVGASLEFRPTQESVWTICGGLGCVPDPASDKPELGVCQRTSDPTDCAGAAPSPSGFCGPPYKPLPPIETIRAQRLMATGAIFLDLGMQSPEKHLGLDVTVGALYQLALTTSRSRELPNGERMHYALPHWYFSLVGFVSKQRIGSDLGIVYKTGFLPLSRVGIGFFGEGWSPVDLLNELEYQAGPSLHIEALNNLTLRGAWLPLNDQGPRWSLSLQYSAGLWENFDIGGR